MVPREPPVQGGTEGLEGRPVAGRPRQSGSRHTFPPPKEMLAAPGIRRLCAKLAERGQTTGNTPESGRRTQGVRRRKKG